MKKNLRIFYQANLSVTGIKRDQGATLIEMLIGAVLGLFVIAAAGSAYVVANRGYITQESYARLQENGRLAMQLLSREIRMAGYFGCAGASGRIHYHTGGVGSYLNGATPIQGFEGHESESAGHWYPGGGANTITRLAGTSDGILIRRLDPDSSLGLRRTMPSRSGAISVKDTNHRFCVGDLVSVSDCDSADIFQITSLTSGQFKEIGFQKQRRIEPGNRQTFPCEPGDRICLSKPYAVGAFIMKYEPVAYYVRDSADGTGPALFREQLTTSTPGDACDGNMARLDSRAVEVVQGIESMQLLFGENTDNSGGVDVFRQAHDPALDWDRVIAVRLGLLVRSLAHGRFVEYGQYGRRIHAGTADNGNMAVYDLDGDGRSTGRFELREPAPYRGARQDFVTTLFLRNLE